VLELFRHYDRDGSGSMDAAELARLLEALGMSPSEEDLRVALDVVDRNRSGKISWSEFSAWWKGR
jgi:Ca2+-binding EF-hand superfamily protein